MTEIPEFDDGEWQAQMDRAFAHPGEDRGRRLYIIIRRGVFLIMAACDVFFGVDDRKRVDKRGRVR